MENKVLNIAWCYPDILNLHGDRGNIMALKKIGELLDLQVNIERIESYNQEIDFEKTDIMFFNAGELKVVKPIVQALEKQRNELTKYIESNKYIVVVGTTGAVFSKEVKMADGESFKGLGILDMNCVQRDVIYGNDILFRLVDDEEMQIIGNQIQIIDTIINSEIQLGNVEYGLGNGKVSEKTEGAKYKNVVFTNTLGPVLVKNPWYTEKIIKDAMKNKGVELNKNIEEEFEIERKSVEAIKKFISKKQ